VLEPPDYVTPFVGWRLWDVVAEGESLRLMSVVYDVAWPVREPLAAECLHRRGRREGRWLAGSGHAPPARRCECGIYAVNDPFWLETYLDHNYARRVSVHRVVGRVSLWGTVIECDRGWRVSHAYPAHPYVPLVPGDFDATRSEYIADEIADYSVPVEVIPAVASEELLVSLVDAEAA
jgi:hypothetical protein